MSIGHFRSNTVLLPVPANDSVSLSCVNKNAPVSLSNLTVVCVLLTRLSPIVAAKTASLPPSASVPLTVTCGDL